MKTMTNKLLRSAILLTLIFAFQSTMVGQTRNEKLIKLIGSYADNKECSFFETTEEMFKLMSKRAETEADPRMLEYFKKTKYVVNIQASIRNGNDWFIDSFIKKANLDDYTLLMRAKSHTRNYKFFKRDLAQNLSEYLLVHRRGLYFMITGMDISTLEEMAGVVEMVSEAGQ